MAKALELAGAKELERKLRTLGDRVQRKVLRQAVNAAATPVVKSVKQKAKKQSGLLKKSLGKKIVTNKKRQSVTAVIGPRSRRPGWVSARRGELLRAAHDVA
jgi:hypothetical protein